MKPKMTRLIFLTVLAVFAVTAFGQSRGRQENLKVVWCEEYKWKLASNQEDATTHLMEIVPGGEDLKKWTLLGTMMSLKNTRIRETEQVIEMYRQSSLKESPKAKLTVLERSDAGRNIWVLFKIETPDFPNDPRPESQLYYAIQGDETLYISSVAQKEKRLSDEFLAKWAKVFKESELVYQ
jgi:hypothetical protein